MTEYFLYEWTYSGLNLVFLNKWNIDSFRRIKFFVLTKMMSWFTCPIISLLFWWPNDSILILYKVSCNVMRSFSISLCSIQLVPIRYSFKALRIDKSVQGAFSTKCSLVLFEEESAPSVIWEIAESPFSMLVVTVTVVSVVKRPCYKLI